MTSFEIPNIAIRAVILLVLASGFGFWAFFRTPQLDGVKDSFIFRVAFWLLLIRGTIFILFDMWELFPID